MGAVTTIAMKDLRILLRDWFGLFWILAFPLMFAIFFGVVFGGSGGGSRGAIAIAIVDEDGSSGSRELIERLARHESLALERRAGEPRSAGDTGSSDPVVLSDVESARDLVRRGRKVAFVRIAEGFGEATWQLFGPGRDDPLIEVGIDPSRSAETGYLQGILMETVLGGMFERFGDRKKTAEEIARWRREVKDSADISAARKLALAAFFVALESFLASTDAISGSDPETDSGSGLAALGREQIEFVDVTRDRSSQPRTAFEISFPAAIVWGLMGCAATFAIVIVRERTAGTLLRLQIAPISWAQLLGGKGLACFLACLGTIVFILLVGRLFLGVRVGSYALLAVAASSTALCFTGMMLAMSVVGKTEPAVAGASWGMMMPLAMIGGGMVPLISMPGWMVTASHFSPFKWSIYALEGAIWRDLSLSELATPCAILLAIAGVCFTAGVWVLGRSFR